MEAICGPARAEFGPAVSRHGIAARRDRRTALDNLDDFARILIVKGTNFTVKPISDPQQLHLWLGYEDDNYDDNGYWGQDEGTQGQCKIGGAFLEHAFAIVTITHPLVIHPVPAGTVKGRL